MEKILIRVNVNKPCNIYIIRKDGANKVKFLGEENEKNVELCKPESKINYTKEEEDKNKIIFNKDIDNTVKLA